jgi:hypothetical protein
MAKVTLDKEGMYTVSDENGLRVVLRRDPVSGKHLVYLVREATSEETFEFLTELSTN